MVRWTYLTLLTLVLVPSECVSMDPGVECVAVVTHRATEWPPLCAHNWDIHLMVKLMILIIHNNYIIIKLSL